MTKLNDAQIVLLSTGPQREDQSLYPLPEIVPPGARVHRAIAPLIGLRKKGHVLEKSKRDDQTCYRIE